MQAVAGILVQEIVRPDVFFYNAGVPQNFAPGINFGGPDGQVVPGMTVARSTSQSLQSAARSQRP